MELMVIKSFLYDVVPKVFRRRWFRRWSQTNPHHHHWKGTWQKCLSSFDVWCYSAMPDFYTHPLTLYRQCTEKQPVLVMVDDAQNMDHLSWKFLCELRKMKGVLIVLSSRPAAIEKPSCEHAEEFMNCSSVRVKDLAVLDTQHIPALACQIMDVVRIPCELEV